MDDQEGTVHLGPERSPSPSCSVGKVWLFFGQKILDEAKTSTPTPAKIAPRLYQLLTLGAKMLEKKLS